MAGARSTWAAPSGALLGLGLVVSPVAAQDNGLHLRLLTSPQAGRVRALVEPDSPLLPTAADFSLLLGSGNAPAGQLTVSRNGDRGGLLTLVVLDDSGSYRTQAGKKLARPAIEEYTRLLGTGDRLALVVFGADARSYAVRTQASAFLGDLDDPGRYAAGNRQNRRATNLLAGLGEAMQLMKKEQDTQRAFPGLSEILLFTDAGDEAAVDTQDWKALFEDADKRTIRISTVISSVRGGSDAKRLATLTRLRSLADQTHGSYENSDNLNQVNATLRSAREAAKSWLLLEGTLCGIKSEASSVAAQIEYSVGGTRKAWTGSGTTFVPYRGPGSDLPCAVAATCTPACDVWQQCTSAKCVTKSCTANENCGTAARCISGACAVVAAPATPKSGLLWIWILVGGALLLGLAALVLLGRRDKKLTAEPPPLLTPPPPTPPPPAEPSEPAPLPLTPAVATSEVVPVAPVLNPLPETHLQAIGGAIRPGEKWRLHKPKMYVGASTDPTDANDIVFNIAAVSSRHALFELFPSGDLWITDQNARNGTFVNGQKLSANERVKLRVGDQVKLSQQLVLQVVRPGFAASTTPLGDEPAAAAAPVPPSGKKHTVFDPGNR